MNAHDDISDRVDAAIGDGPAHRPIETRLAAGRSAVRRRRVAVAAGALTVATVVGGAAWLAAPGSGSQDQTRDNAPAIADDPGTDTADGAAKAALTPDRVIYRTPRPTPEQSGQLLGRSSFLAFAWEDTDLLVKRGYTFVRRIDGFVKGKVSVAATMKAPQGHLLNIVLVAGDGVWRQVETADGLEGWARREVREMGADDAASTDTGDSGMPGTVDGSDYVQITSPGSPLAPVGGTTILDQQSDPHLPDNFATPGDPSWVAHIRDHRGAEWFVLVRKVGPAGEYIAVPSADAGSPATLDRFLDWARQRYESEVGVR